MAQDRDLFPQFTIGQTASRDNTVERQHIEQFARVSGDHNPLHTHEDFAKKTRFKGIIAHGMLTASFISAVIGNDLPGAGCVYVSQSLSFKAPVRIGDTVKSLVTITHIDEKKRLLRLHTQCSVENHVVLDGTAVIYIP